MFLPRIAKLIASTIYYCKDVFSSSVGRAVAEEAKS